MFKTSNIVGAGIVIVLLVGIIWVTVGSGSGESFKLNLENISSTHNLTKGVVIVHAPNTNFNYLGVLSPNFITELAQDGNIKSIMEEASNDKFVYEIYKVKSLSTGDSATLDIEVSKDDLRYTFLSGVESVEDTLVFINGQKLFDSSGNTRTFDLFAEVLDNGTRQTENAEVIDTIPQAPMRHSQTIVGQDNIILLGSLVAQ